MCLENKTINSGLKSFWLYNNRKGQKYRNNSTNVNLEVVINNNIIYVIEVVVEYGLSYNINYLSNILEYNIDTEKKLEHYDDLKNCYRNILFVNSF